MSTGPREGNLNTSSHEESQNPDTANQQILSTDAAERTPSDIVNEGREESNVVVSRGNDDESSTPKRFSVPHAFNKPTKKEK